MTQASARIVGCLDSAPPGMRFSADNRGRQLRDRYKAAWRASQVEHSRRLPDHVQLFDADCAIWDLQLLNHSPVFRHDSNVMVIVRSVDANKNHSYSPWRLTKSPENYSSVLMA